MTAKLSPSHARARTALEIGRLTWAAPRALALACGALLLASVLGSQAPTPVVGVLVGLVALVAGGVSRQALQGATLGLLVSSAPMILAAALVDSTHLCGAGLCLSLCSVACAASGVVGGVALVAVARAAERFASHIVLGATAAGALHVMVGCAMSGHGQLVGLVAGVALGAPLSWAAQRRRAVLR